MCQQDPLGTELSDFCRLPRPDPLLHPSPSLDDLRRAFPFLFKPNRALVLHARTAAADLGHPSEEPHGRWLLLLRLGEPLSDLPPCIAVVGQDGWLSLWCYAQDSGLLPLQLESREGTRVIDNSLCFRESTSMENAALPMELVRATGQTDDEGRHHLTLDTIEGSHRLTLDFGAVRDLPSDPIPYEWAQHPPRDSLLSIRQIGGWDGKESFHWNESNVALYCGGGRRRERLDLDPSFEGVQLLAAARCADLTVIGGQSDRLYLQHKESSSSQVTRVGNPLRGHVYSLAILESTRELLSGPFVLVGCDDHVLYVLNRLGHQVQKVRLGGLVQGILPLNHEGNEWVDLALLIRNRGLFCARLFLDRMHLAEPFEPDRTLFDQKASELLCDTPRETLRRWLRSEEPVDRMIAVRLIVNEPTKERVGLFDPRAGLLKDLDDYSTGFLAHCLQRALRRLEEHGELLDNQRGYTRQYMDLFLSMAKGSYHSRMVVRQLEGWLLGLSREAQDPEIRDKLHSLREVLPDAKNLYAQMAEEASGSEEQDPRSAMALLASLHERLEYDRLFNEHVRIPAEGQGQVRAVAMLPGNGGITTQVYAPRGAERLQSFRLDEILTSLPEREAWTPSLEIPGGGIPGSIRGLLPLAPDLLLVVASDRIGWVARGIESVHWSNPLPTPLWCAARRKDAQGITIALSGDWSGDTHYNSPAVLIYGWDGSRLIRSGVGLSPPSGWHRRTQIRAMCWDDEGGLWATTADQGEVLNWSPTTIRDGQEPVILARLGVAQYSLALLPGLVITGGADGAVRAFSRSGGLRWLYPTAGPVRSVVSLPSLSRVKNRQPRIALATEAEHIVLLDEDGGQVAMLFLANSHPFSLAASKLEHDKQLHLAVGTLEGELRVLEVVTDGWQKRYSDIQSPERSRRLDRRREAYCQDRALLETWCSPQIVRQEPLQTAWAADQLMKIHGDPSSALNVASGLKGLHPATRRLRALLFGILGRRIKQIEMEGLYRLLDNASLEARDGAVAALIDGLDDDLALTKHTLIRLLARTLTKVRLGRPFTTSALLRRLYRLPSSFAELADTVLIHGVRRRVKVSVAEAQLVEGLLARLFSGDRPHNEALLWSLIRLPEKHSAFFTRLLDPDKSCRSQELTELLLFWIDNLQGVLFGPNNRAAWCALRPFLGPRVDRNVTLDSLDELAENLPSRANADRKALDMYRHLFPTMGEVSDRSLFPRPWQPLAQTSTKLRDLRRQLAEKGISATRANGLLESGQRQVNSVQCQNPIVRPLVTAWKQAWKEEFERWRDLLIPSEPADWLLPQPEPLRVVDGEDAPLIIHLCNQGPNDIRESVRLWLDRATQRLFVEKGPASISHPGGMQCAAEGARAGEVLTLKRTLRASDINGPIDILVHWTVGEQRRSHKFRITPEARWNDYMNHYPKRDRLAAGLFRSRDGMGFRYGRIIVRRWREFSLVAGRRDLTELVRSWAERAGRSGELRLCTPEEAWPGAEARSPDRWEDYLKQEPQGLEIWLLEDTIPLGLRFLNLLEQAPRTALLLPDLALEDSGSALDSRQSRLLDTILSARGENRLAPLQLALKACAQGVVFVPTAKARHLPQVALGAAVRHSAKRLLRRGEIPNHATWNTPTFGGWPVAGCRDLHKYSDLPPDPARPLNALVGSDALRHLWRLGLVMRWGDVWVSRSRVLIDYADQVFPTRRIGVAPHANDGVAPWSWDLSGWKGQSLEAAQRRLFANPGVPLDHPPFEGLDISEWECLRQHLQRYTVADSFFSILGLSRRRDFHDFLNHLNRWRKVMDGENDVLGPVLKQLADDGVAHEELPSTIVGGRHFKLLGLNPGGTGVGGGRFSRLLLLLPAPNVYKELRRSKDKPAEHLVPWLQEIRSQLSDAWKHAIALVFLDTETISWTSLANQHDLVILDSRSAMRLATGHSPRQALLESIQSQIPLSQLAQDVFQSEGPVKKPNHFFGRESELRHICEGLAHGKSYVVTGPRSIGKSSLLIHLPDSPFWKQHLSQRFLPLFLDLQEQRTGFDYGEFLDQLLKSIDRSAVRLSGATMDHVRTTLDNRDTLTKETTKTAAGKLLDALEKQLRPVIPVLLVDEADGFYTADRTQGEPMFTLFRARHNADQLRFVFASYPPEARSMAASIQDASAQAYNFLEQIDLGPLERNAGLELIKRGMAEVAVGLGDRQIGELCDGTWAIPNLLQKACLDLLKLLDSRLRRGEGRYVTQDVIDRALDSAQGWLLTHFMHYFDEKHVRPALYVLAAMVLEDQRCLNPDEAVAMFVKHAPGDVWRKDKVKTCLEPLLDTLLLERRIPDYCFGGPSDRPYFPTLVRSVWGIERLHDIVLHDMDSRIWHKDT